MIKSKKAPLQPVAAQRERAVSASVFTKTDRSVSDPEAVVQNNPLNAGATAAEEL